MNSQPAGCLYVVATPIGNLEDITVRALRILREVDLILAEDTRTSGVLLRYFGIQTPVEALFAHNEQRRSEHYLGMIQAGRKLALISDAGTPLINDPGFPLVRAARGAGLAVVPVPGPSSVMAALSVCALPVDRFCYEGFLPSTAGARREKLEQLRAEPRTMVFLEAPHRLEETLTAMVEVFGAGRNACLARELTKHFETITTRPLAELAAFVAGDPNQQRGEMVLCVAGAAAVGSDLSEALRIGDILSRYLPPGRAAAATAEITGVARKQIYRGMLGAEGEPDAENA
jgi:16S rRNA (cytidine1402-2'-O)-methyltransferase